MTVTSGTVSSANPVSSVCASGFYLSSGACLPCGVGAVTCTNIGLATSCITG
jgi:hypothetical protein